MPKRIFSKSKKNTDQIGLELVALAGEPLQITDVSLSLPSEMTFEKWRLFAPFFRRENVRSQSIDWLLADWLAFGGDKFCTRDESGRFKLTPAFSRYAQTAEQTGYAESTLRTWAVISRAIPASMRRHPSKLSFKHHRAVCALDGNQDKEHWLNRAETDELSVSELTMEIRSWLAKNDRQDSLGLINSNSLLIGFVSDLERRFSQLRNSSKPIESWPQSQRAAVKLDVLKLQSRTNNLCAALLEELG